MWIEMENPDVVRGENYQMLFDTQTGNNILIQTETNQPDNDLNLHV